MRCYRTSRIFLQYYNKTRLVYQWKISFSFFFFFFFFFLTSSIPFSREFNYPVLILAIQFPNYVDLKCQELLLNWDKVSYSVRFSYLIPLRWALIWTLHSLLPRNKVLPGLILHFEDMKIKYLRKNKCANIIEKCQPL